MTDTRRPYVDVFHYSPLPWAEYGAVLQESAGLPTDVNRRADYARAVACVEACVGIRDPSDVKYMISLIKSVDLSSAESSTRVLAVMRSIAEKWKGGL